VLLRPHADAAEHGRAGERCVDGELGQVGTDLRRELAGRGEDERARHAAALGEKALHHG
jgi:hypothetical protein